MCQLPKPILLNYKHNYLLQIEISIVSHTFFKTQHTIICFRHRFKLETTLSSKHYTQSSPILHTSSMPNLLVFRQNTLPFKWQNFHFQCFCISGAQYSCIQSIFHCTVFVKLLKQIQSATIDDQDIFLNINTVSLAPVDCVLRRNTLRMKQVYRVPFARNCDSQTIML